jgi:hypothetical protein
MRNKQYNEFNVAILTHNTNNSHNIYDNVILNSNNK